jgi:hypothetical protein
VPEGYSSFQEYHLFLRSLIFDPDFLAVGFCMNDVTEPFVVNKTFGGTGIDYSSLTRTNMRNVLLFRSHACP